MSTNPLDLIEARVKATAKLFSGQHDVMPTHFQDRAKLVAALRAVEAAENDLDHPDYCGIEFNQPCTCWHAQIIAAIREALG